MPGSWPPTSMKAGNATRGGGGPEEDFFYKFIWQAKSKTSLSFHEYKWNIWQLSNEKYRLKQTVNSWFSETLVFLSCALECRAKYSSGLRVTRKLHKHDCSNGAVVIKSLCWTFRKFGVVLWFDGNIYINARVELWSEYKAKFRCWHSDH
jgi:hypothetical protein